MTLLILDVGSSSVRAMLFDREACLIPGAMVRQEHQMITTHDGGAYFEIAALQDRIEQCIDAILEHPAAKNIEAIGMDTFVGNILGIDTRGNPLTPILTYADTRSANNVELLRSVYDASDTHQRTGCPHHTAYLPAQLHWFKRTHPDVFTKILCWQDIGTFLYQRWFGKAIPMSYSVASWTGLLNRADLKWDAAWSDVLGLTRDHFPVLADYDSVLTGLDSPYRERWPLLADVPFFLPLGDGAAANVGAGALNNNTIALSLGTTAALRIISTEKMPMVPAGLWSYRVDRSAHLIGGATSEGGNIYHWIKNQFKLGDETENELLQSEADIHGLTFIPLLAGERSPYWHSEATGSIVGLRLSTTGKDILQAALEGVAIRLKLIYDLLPKPDDHQIMAVGGALEASPAWAQVIADTFAHELGLIKKSEITASGTAMLVLKALYNQALEDFPRPSISRVVPNPLNSRRLARALERHLDLYHLLQKR